MDVAQVAWNPFRALSFNPNRPRSEPPRVGTRCSANANISPSLSWTAWSARRTVSRTFATLRRETTASNKQPAQHIRSWPQGWLLPSGADWKQRPNNVSCICFGAPHALTLLGQCGCKAELNCVLEHVLFAIQTECCWRGTDNIWFHTAHVCC